ncbi:hypothetical protein [Thermoproteus tenax]|uniref:hypothetical protein n=1 Tax=Thermoproteus tenax TaxID=2271 RepID=UPI000B0730A1|nr:hypothetical protein [Thermoproteus tenax]
MPTPISPRLTADLLYVLICLLALWGSGRWAPRGGASLEAGAWAAPLRRRALLRSLDVLRRVMSLPGPVARRGLTQYLSATEGASRRG